MTIRKIIAAAAAVAAGAALLVLPAAPAGAGDGTSTTTSTTIDPTTCPGGPECYGFSIDPTSGPAGTVINVQAVLGACTAEGTTVILWDNLPPSGEIGSPILAETDVSPGAGNATGTLTVPDGTAPGDYRVAMAASGDARCEATFTVTGAPTPLETTTTAAPAAVVAQPAYTG